MVRQSILAFIRNDLKTETKFYGVVMIIYGYIPGMWDVMVLTGKYVLLS